MIAKYITKEELQQYLVLEDEELNEEYQQLRKANSAFYIREWKVPFRKPFSWKHPFRKREEVVTRYEVLEDLDGQARICIFPNEKGDKWSIRTLINELELKTFIYGFLNGTDATLKELEWHHGKPKFSVGNLVKVVDREIRDKICEEHGWTTSNGYESLCGRQFTVSDVRYSYASKEYTYQIERRPDSAWIREELLEAYKEEPKRQKKTPTKTSKETTSCNPPKSYTATSTAASPTLSMQDDTRTAVIKKCSTTWNHSWPPPCNNSDV